MFKTLHTAFIRPLLERACCVLNMEYIKFTQCKWYSNFIPAILSWFSLHNLTHWSVILTYCLNPLRDLYAICVWPACDLHVICMYLHVTCMWSACICMWSACDLQVTCMWPACDLHVTSAWSNCLTTKLNQGGRWNFVSFYQSQQHSQVSELYAKNTVHLQNPKE